MEDKGITGLRKKKTTSLIAALQGEAMEVLKTKNYFRNELQWRSFTAYFTIKYGAENVLVQTLEIDITRQAPRVSTGQLRFNTGRK